MVNYVNSLLSFDDEGFATLHDNEITDLVNKVSIKFRLSAWDLETFFRNDVMFDDYDTEGLPCYKMGKLYPGIVKCNCGNDWWCNVRPIFNPYKKLKRKNTDEYKFSVFDDLPLREYVEDPYSDWI